MKIKVLSDLHLEFGAFELRNPDNCDVLVLAGDIAPAEMLDSESYSGVLLAQRAHELFAQARNHFEHVLWIAGNHEFYENDWDATLLQCAKIAAQYNIKFCENRAVQIADVLFVCATLWTDFYGDNPLAQQAVARTLNDYKYILHSGAKLHTQAVLKRHRESLEFFSDVCATAARVVVVTHHAPSILSIPQHFRNDLISAAYCSDLSEWVYARPQVELWLHGHTHSACDYRLHATRVVCNPRGYAGYNERTNWDPELVLKL